MNAKEITEFKTLEAEAVESLKKCIDGTVKSFPYLTDEEIAGHIDNMVRGSDEQISLILREAIESRRIEWKERN